MAVAEDVRWLRELDDPRSTPPANLVPVATNAESLPPDERWIIERGADYRANYVFFAMDAIGKRTPIALVYSNDSMSDEEFAEIHWRLWSWGRVPLIYRKTKGRVDLLRCAHEPEFWTRTGERTYCAFKTLDLLTTIEADLNKEPWWDASQLATGALWDQRAVAEQFLSASESAHPRLVRAIQRLDATIRAREVLPDPSLGRRLLVLTLLIAYLEDRGVLDADTFSSVAHQATCLSEVLSNGSAVVRLFQALADRFNGDVFHLDETDSAQIVAADLRPFVEMIEGKCDDTGQLSLFRLYSFRDLPIEMISHIYELFVTDDGSVYTPLFLVHLLLEEALDWERLERILEEQEVVLDPACGSGVFLVEAYRRLVLAWRHKNNWMRPGVDILRRLLTHIQGVDRHQKAIELTAFSLCLALCDATDVDTLRDTSKLFPKLKGQQLFNQCFFEWSGTRDSSRRIGVIIGNPPFVSRFTTEGARAAARSYKREVGHDVADKQLAYLFLHSSMQTLTSGGIVCMLQPYGFLYNEKPSRLRQQIFARWDVREVLDFVSIRGLFRGDTKVVCIVAEASPPSNRPVLHAVFRRTNRVAKKQGFDIDYYDLHRLSRHAQLDDSVVWRCNLVGGARVRALVSRLRKERTVARYAREEMGWDMGEGFIRGTGDQHPDFLRGAPDLLPSVALTTKGIDWTLTETVPDEPVQNPRTEARFTAPLLLIREQMDLPMAFIEDGFLAYRDQIVGISAPASAQEQLKTLSIWLEANRPVLRAYLMATSTKLFVKRNTNISSKDIENLPFPITQALDLSPNEQIVLQDIVDYYCDLTRIGQKSAAASRRVGKRDLEAYRQTLAAQVATFYPGVQPLESYHWPGFICQPFVFADGDVDWSGVEGLRAKLQLLLTSEEHSRLSVRRIARVYDGHYVFFIKPDVLGYWLRSIALRDADGIVADLTGQGF